MTQEEIVSRLSIDLAGCYSVNSSAGEHQAMVQKYVNSSSVIEGRGSATALFLPTVVCTGIRVVAW